MNAEIRPAVVADAREVAEVHVRGWQRGYAGQLPEDFLQSLSVDARETGWAHGISEAPETTTTLVADLSGVIAGFVNTGASRDADAPAGTGELNAIYVDPVHWRSGFGRLLHDAGLDALRGNGFRSVTLWVLATNSRARQFYAATGWQPDGAERTEDLRGIELREVRYARDLGSAGQREEPPMHD